MQILWKLILLWMTASIRNHTYSELQYKNKVHVQLWRQTTKYSVGQQTDNLFWNLASHYVCFEITTWRLLCFNLWCTPRESAFDAAGTSDVNDDGAFFLTVFCLALNVLMMMMVECSFSVSRWSFLRVEVDVALFSERIYIVRGSVLFPGLPVRNFFSLNYFCIDLTRLKSYLQVFCCFSGLKFFVRIFLTSIHLCTWSRHTMTMFFRSYV